MKSNKSGMNPNKLTDIASVRATNKDLKMIDKLAELSGLTRSEWLKEAINSKMLNDINKFSAYYKLLYYVIY